MNNTLERIEHAALIYFSQEGFQGTTLNDIARKVGISKPSIYFYFKSKEELFTKILMNQVDEYISNFNEVLEDNKNECEDIQLFFIFKYHIQYFSKNILSAKFFVSCIFFNGKTSRDNLSNNADLIRLENLLENNIKDIFVEGIKKSIFKDTDISLLTLSFYWLIRSFLVRIASYGESFDDKNIQGYWQIYFGGIEFNK